MSIWSIPHTYHNILLSRSVKYSFSLFSQDVLPFFLLSCIQGIFFLSLPCPHLPWISSLSYRGKFGCFTSLRFKGACLLTTAIQTLYHIAKALSGSVQFNTWVNGTQCRSVQEAVLLTCLKDRNDVYEKVLGAHFGSLIDLEQESQVH